MKTKRIFFLEKLSGPEGTGNRNPSQNYSVRMFGWLATPTPRPFTVSNI
jgi:hypothetical protein